MKRVFTCLIALFAIITCSVGQPSGTDGPPTNGQVFTFVEQMPEFPGGDAELIKFLSQNVRYPQMERDNGIQGKVIVHFVIMEDGGVDSVEVFRGVSPGLDKEAVRVIKMLPRFKPGMQQGKAVRVYYNIPLVFKLTDPAPVEKKKGKKKKG